MLPFGLIEQIIRLINLILESTPIEQRRAQSLLWFNLWWPILKNFLNEDQQKQIDRIISGA